MIREILAAALIGLGAVCCVLSVFGVYKFDYVLTRIHAAAVIDTLGTLLIFAGLIVLRGLGWAAAKIVLILLFQWVTGPVSTHRISRVEVMTNPDYEQHCEVKR
ncbi:MAG: monovalent cation/H(+) antiporter subunit G [Oscillospiraceae bacterium]|nr:monovalent cation/H(+) antiporter subunit G [Oscillospiraceae bacterium]